MLPHQEPSAATRAERRLAFAGTPAFAATVLTGLIAAGFNFQCVYTQPDRPFGRGRRKVASAVTQVAAAHGIAIRTPTRLRPADIVSGLRDLSLDVLIVAAYGLILPQPILTAPRLGCLNVHASLLPRWRGAAPIERAMIEGDQVTGVTIMQMDDGLDTGPILQQAEFRVPSGATGDEVHHALARLGTASLIKCLDALERLPAVAQSDAEATYAPKLTPADSRLDWELPADVLARRILALHSRQPAVAYLNAQRLRVLRASATPPRGDVQANTGEIISAGKHGIDVACGNRTVLRITELQMPGKGATPADALVRGHARLFATHNRWRSDAPTE